MDAREAQEARRLGDRQWPEECRVDKAENERARADAERCGQDRDNREARLLAQGPAGERAILQQVAPPACDPCSTRRLVVKRCVAELPMRLASRGRSAHALGNQFLDLHLEVRGHLLMELARPLLAVQPIGNPSAPALDAHASPITRAIAPDIWR